MINAAVDRLFSRMAQDALMRESGKPVFPAQFSGALIPVSVRVADGNLYG